VLSPPREKTLKLEKTLRGAIAAVLTRRRPPPASRPPSSVHTGRGPRPSLVQTGRGPRLSLVQTGRRRTPPSRCQALMNTIKEEDLVENMSISKEIGFRICDKLTRKTRQLIKMISVVDMAK
jgi:hypothetical protein